MFLEIVEIKGWTLVQTVTAVNQNAHNIKLIYPDSFTETIELE